MKNLFKKIGALLVAAVMVLSMCTAVFADDNKSTVPSEGDTGSITVKNLQAGDKVDIVKIVKANYSGFGFSGFEAVYKIENTATPADVEHPTTTEIADLTNVQGIFDNGSTQTVSETATEVTFSNLAVGMYLIKVTPKAGNITTYNPMIASINYKDANTGTPINGEVDATANWEIGTTVAYAKSTQNYKPDKVIVKEETKDNQTIKSEVKNDVVKKGATVKFKISGTIPAYSKDSYKNPKYELTDTLSRGLTLATGYADTLKKNINDALKAKDAVDAVDAVDVTIDNNVISIKFKNEYLWSVANKTASERKYSFEYEATVNGTEYNLDASTNSVQLTYSRTPSEDKHADPVKTYHYTFNINGEIRKVDANNQALSGAVFQLFTDSDCKIAAKTVNNENITSTSNDQGLFDFAGLDEETYYLKEIKAPDSYQLTNKVYRIKFDPTFDNTSNEMTSYKVVVTELNSDGTDGKSVESTYGLKEANNKVEVTNIQNTKLSSLPSTGGMGTYLFTIIGVVVMAGAAGAFFISRRKGSEE